VATQESQARGAHKEGARHAGPASVRAGVAADGTRPSELGARMLRIVSVTSIHGYAAPEVEADHLRAESLAGALWWPNGGHVQPPSNSLPELQQLAHVPHPRRARFRASGDGQPTYPEDPPDPADGGSIQPRARIARRSSLATLPAFWPQKPLRCGTSRLPRCAHSSGM
jgi:hypothetical protein